MQVQILNKFNCQSYPLTDMSKVIDVSEEELSLIGISKCFDLDTLKVVDYDNSKELKIKEIEENISKLKQFLDETDYKVLKFYEGEYTDEQFEPIKLDRKNARIKIRELEQELENLTE